MFNVSAISNALFALLMKARANTKVESWNTYTKAHTFSHMNKIFIYTKESYTYKEVIPCTKW